MMVRIALVELALVALTWPLMPHGSEAADEFSDPPHYVKKSTWEESIRSSREALVALERAAERPTTPVAFSSEIVRGAERAQKISVRVTGEEELFLYVVGAPDTVWGAATWADAKLIGADGSEVSVSNMKGLRVLEGRHDIDVNMKAGVSGPLSIAGQHFERGIHVYANSKVRVPLGGKYTRFEASIGIDDWVGQHGAVRFHAVGPEGAARLDLWTRAALDFSEETPRRQMKWVRQDRILEADWEPGDYAALAKRYAEAARRVFSLSKQAAIQAIVTEDAPGLRKTRDLYYRSRELDETLARAKELDFEALRLAIDDLVTTFGRRYSGSQKYLARLSAIEEGLSRAISRTDRGELADFERVAKLSGDFDLLKSDALLANPLLDFKHLLLIRRVPHGDPRRAAGRGYGVGEYIGTPRQSSKCNPNIEEPFSWENEIAVLSPVRPDGKLTTFHGSEEGRLITDVDLNFDADKLLFSMPGSHQKWHVFELGTDGQGFRQLTPEDQPDVHYYDACYLPNGRIAFVSTAPLQGVPCNAGVIVGMMYTMAADGSDIRQICFEQDHNYCPTVMNDGRIMYLRWDYTDTPHVWNRMLFSANPDGTGQAELYGSNSYWPNSIFFTRCIPDHPTKLVGIVTGHHVGRVGELIILDPARGRHETDGVVQRIPGRGQEVEPLIEDKLTEHSWPKFIHPYPLSEKHFITACKPTPDSLWGIYLVDTFDNMVLIKEQERHVLLEPIPYRRTRRPPIIPDRVDSSRDDAVVYMSDVYAGPGLEGIPRGSVQSLRVFTYHFGYQKIAGINHRVGSDGPWEVKRVLGTVPVREDGSAFFRVPAKTPISVQPLDENGQALALMRSWMTAMPGETLSCVGCHEDHNSSPPPLPPIATRYSPLEIEPWRGPVRGFSFEREVQPVLDKYCVSCHDGSRRDEGPVIPNLRGDQTTLIAYRHGDPEAELFEDKSKAELMKTYNAIFGPSYLTLRKYVRVGGLESDLHLLPPMEFHANTNELVQMLQKGHHNVKLDDEAWDRLATWIDLNAPCHGTWSELTGISGDQRKKRHALRRLYGGVDEDAETIPEIRSRKIVPVVPEPLEEVEMVPVKCDDWPIAFGEAARRQSATDRAMYSVELNDRVAIEMARIPAGSFVIGDPAGEIDERPQAAVAVESDFWISRHEITNRQYAQFDPAHESRFEHRTSWIFSEEYLGWPLDGPDQPVVRVSWDRAMAFCGWLSEKTGMTFTLPTEAQWEYACRAGSEAPLSYGDSATDFSKFGNMADRTMRELAYQAWRPKPPDLVPRDDRFNDGVLVTAEVGTYLPNAWGLYDMHGNVAEWTRSAYRPYPYLEDDGRNDPSDQGEKVVRGGSWRDRPKRCRSSFRLSYPPYQRVYNVGFRVMCESVAGKIKIASAAKK